MRVVNRYTPITALLEEMKYPKLITLSRFPHQGVDFHRFSSKHSKELCYINNPYSLFRRYSHLVTWFSNLQIGRNFLDIPSSRTPILLMLPNGYHLQTDHPLEVQSTFFTRPVFSPLITPALQVLDGHIDLFSSVEQVQRSFLHLLGLRRDESMYREMATKLLTAFGPFYPDASPETTTTDGTITRGAAGETHTWSDLHDGAGTSSESTGTNRTAARYQSANTLDRKSVV